MMRENLFKLSAMKKTFLLSLTALLSTLSIAACSVAEKEDPAPELTGTSWMMKLDSKSGCDVAPYIEFTEKKVTGDLGCNSFSGDYKRDGNKLSFQNVAATLRMCDPASMALEEKMQRLLKDTRRIRGNPEALSFIDSKGKVILTLVPESMGACR